MYQIEDNNIVIPVEDFLKINESDMDKLKTELRFRRVRKTEEHKSEDKQIDFVKTISEKLCVIGVRKHLMGYEYLRKAIYMCVTEPKNINHMTSLYTKIAKDFGTLPSRVERAIRHAKELSGNDIHNTEFIANIVDEIRLELNMITF